MSVKAPAPAAAPSRPSIGRLPGWVRYALRTALHLLCDAAALVLAFRAAYQLRFHWAWLTERIPIEGTDPGWALYAQILYAVIPVWVAVFWYAGRLYTQSWASPFDRFLHIVKGNLLGTLATLAITFIFARLTYSRLMILMAAPLTVLFVSLTQFLVLKLDRWMSGFETVRPLLLVGGGRVAQVIRENVHARHPKVPIHELHTIPSPEGLIERARHDGIGEVVLLRGGIGHSTLLELAEACEASGIGFRLIPDLLELRLGEVQMDDSLGLPAFHLQHTQLTRTNFLAKRVFDVLFALAVFTVLGLPLLAVALLIRWDSRGPALFKQKRIGLRGKPFEAYKFRTMVLNAEAGLSAVRDRNDQKGGFFKAKADPRVTRVGRWLRRYSVDEFPQFINVLLGDMSVVGPRPLALTTGEMEELVRLFGRTARKRTNILPGITGLWQVSGRSDISAEQRFSLDLFYIEHWSLGLDLEIILKTLPAMLSARGAY